MKSFDHQEALHAFWRSGPATTPVSDPEVELTAAELAADKLMSEPLINLDR